MRILIVTAWFPSVERPAAGVFHLRDAELLARDHRVTVLHVGALVDSEEDVDGIRVIHRALPSGKLSSYLRARALVNRLLGSHDLLHTMSFPTLLPLLLVRPRLPWVHTEHWTGLVWPPAGMAARWGAALAKGLLRRPDEVVAVGDRLAEAIEAVRHRPVHRIANFVRPAPQTSGTGAVSEDDAVIRLIGVSGLQPHKGALIAVEAAAVLRARGMDVRLTWAGDGPQRDALRARAEDLGIGDVVALPGHVDPDALSALLLAADAMVAPTAFETFGVAIAEALTHGLPVVATGEGGHWSFLPPQASRRAERTPEALADAIQELLADPECWPAEAIRAYAGERFDAAARRKAYAEVYAAALSDASTD